MPCSALYYLIDELGGIWNLNVTNSGIVQVTATVLPLTTPVAFITLQDRAIASNWQITVRSDGFLVINAVPPVSPPGQQPPLWLGLLSPNSTLFRLQIVNSVLQAQKQPPVTGPIPVVGTIYNPDSKPFSPKFTQPGGPGTATFPQQDPGEMLGLFVFGCGHWMNNFDVISATVNCDQVAVIRCPLCYFVQRIINPYSDIHSFQNEILIA